MARALRPRYGDELQRIAEPISIPPMAVVWRKLASAIGPLRSCWSRQLHEISALDEARRTGARGAEGRSAHQRYRLVVANAAPIPTKVPPAIRLNTCP